MLKIIDNFTGRLTRDNIGDMNSGLAKYPTTFGSDSFSNPGNLTWFEQPQSILSSATQGIMTAKVRLEGNINYVYAVGSGVDANGDTPTLFKIQVNNTSTNNPDYDNPSIIGGITTESGSILSVNYGPSMQFYGTTENIFIGSDQRITKLNFGGSTIGHITNISSVTTNVPRPSAQFLGKMYWGNGSNLIEIDSTETVTSYAKLTPGFPSGTYIRDLDITPDGNYLQITVSKNNSPSQTQFNPDFSTTTSGEAYRFLWNGTDATYTSFESYSGYSLSANTVFGQHNFTLGTDLNGSALYTGATKIITLPQVTPPNYNATFSTGNLLGFAAPEYNSSITGSNASSVVGLQASTFFYGQYDNQIPLGLYRTFKQSASVASGDDEVIRVPVCLPVSNLAYTYTGAGYANNILSSSKLYFSTTERQAGNIVYRLYKFITTPTGTGTTINGVYETQQETSFHLFRSIVSKKFKVNQVRFYTSPLVVNNSFQIDLIGSDGNPLTGGTQTFTVGTNVNAGDDIIQYTPTIPPTYSVGVRITNLGSVNWVGVKMELEYEEAGVK